MGPPETDIHPAAVVHPGAELGPGVAVGPYAVVEDDVVVGSGSRIRAHAVIRSGSRLGTSCEVHPGAVIGGEPQDFEFRGEKSLVRIGDETVIREAATVHRATGEGEATVVGEGSYLMAYSHVAHNCRVGHGVVLANSASLGGHVVLEDECIVSGLAGIHQGVRIGTLVMVGGHTKVVKDVPPYMLCDGHPARVIGLNLVGLRRNGFGPRRRDSLKRAFRILYRSGLNVTQALERLEELAGEGDEEHEGRAELERLIQFVRNSERGITR